MNLIICDDNVKFAELLANRIKKIRPKTVIYIYSTLKELFFKLEDNAAKIDAIFMDIKHKDGNGIEAWQKIHKKYPKIKVVFVTGYGDEYSQSIFLGSSSAAPTAFLVKPVNDKFLKNAIEKAEETTVDKELLIPIKDNDTTVFIPQREIISVSSKKRKIIIITINNDYEIYGSITDFKLKLPENFVQCHRSHIINITHIHGIENWNTVKMKNNTEFPISRTYRNELKLLITDRFNEVNII